MRKIFTFIFIFNLFALITFGQPCICPGKISVSGPAEIVRVGQNIVFTADVQGDKDNRSIYNWTINSGVIISGQGTKSITVQTNAEMERQTITATVEVSGNWCPVCDKMYASETATIENLPQPVLVDKFTRGNCEDVLSRMDYFFTELQNDPTAIGYFIAYGKPKPFIIAEREARNWINIKRFDPSRITFMRGGGNSDKAEIELWLVPSGANPPEVKSMPETVVQETEKETPKPIEPYIFSSEYYDGIAGCEEELNLEGFAEMLKENPKSRGNIVIMELTRSGFLKKEREILRFLTKQGISRQRLKTFHQKVFGGVELWFLP